MKSQPKLIKAYIIEFGNKQRLKVNVDAVFVRDLLNLDQDTALNLAVNNECIYMYRLSFQYLNHPNPQEKSRKDVHLNHFDLEGILKVLEIIVDDFTKLDNAQEVICIKNKVDSWRKNVESLRLELKCV